MNPNSAAFNLIMRQRQSSNEASPQPPQSFVNYQYPPTNNIVTSQPMHNIYNPSNNIYNNVNQVHNSSHLNPSYPYGSYYQPPMPSFNNAIYPNPNNTTHLHQQTQQQAYQIKSTNSSMIGSINEASYYNNSGYNIGSLYPQQPNHQPPINNYNNQHIPPYQTYQHKNKQPNSKQQQPNIRNINTALVSPTEKSSNQPYLSYCEPCDKEFNNLKSFEDHNNTHELCRHPGCSFSASKKVVQGKNTINDYYSE